MKAYTFIWIAIYISRNIFIRGYFKENCTVKWFEGPQALGFPVANIPTLRIRSGFTGAAELQLPARRLVCPADLMEFPNQRQSNQCRLMALTHQLQCQTPAACSHIRIYLYASPISNRFPSPVCHTLKFSTFALCVCVFASIRATLWQTLLWFDQEMFFVLLVYLFFLSFFIQNPRLFAACSSIEFCNFTSDQWAWQAGIENVICPNVSDIGGQRHLQYSKLHRHTRLENFVSFKLNLILKAYLKKSFVQ